jgi:hypothetical protein
MKLRKSDSYTLFPSGNSSVTWSNLPLVDLTTAS